MINSLSQKLPLIISTALYSALTLNAGLVHSAGIQEDGSTATDVTTVNQVDIVNIATPTTGGVSQNRFDRFSIDANGAVMNNATVDGTSNLAGQLQANPNLSAGSARIILNEVTSNRQSNLNGTTEIFGDNARYILSNPNGITCNGCGFIRTPTAVGDTGTRIEDVFLTTGTANVNATTGLPITLTVGNNNQAQLIIGQNGLDTSNVDITTLLTRRAEINGIVNAASSQLNLYLGKGALSVNDNAASTWVASTTGNTVSVAIDANSAGAMNAGQIFIQSTEDGAGVTLPNSLVSTSDITLSAAGDIVYRNATAQGGDVTVTATGTNSDITSNGSTTASANVTLSASGNINTNITTAQGGDITVTTSGTNSDIALTGNTTASGNVSINGQDDVSYNNITAQNGNVTVTTQTANAEISTSGNTQASNNITWNISGTRTRVNGSGGAVTFNAGNTLLLNCTVADGSCDLQSQRELIFQTALLQSNADIITTAGNNLTVNAALTTSQGINSGANATFTSASGNIDIKGNLIAANNIQLTSAQNAQIILDGNVQAGGNIAFLGQGHYTHDTNGTFTIGGDYQFDLFSLTNNAILIDLQNGSLRVNELTNNGLIENQSALNLKVDDTLNNTGIIASLEGAVTIGHSTANQKTNSITNSGVIASIDLTSSQLGQTGLILDPAALIAEHTYKILHGEQRSAEELAAEIEIENAALIATLNANATVTGVVTLNANTLTNTASGRVSGSDVLLSVGTLNNQGGQILAGRNLNIQGTSLSNTNVNSQFGVLTARNNLDLTLSGNFNNTGLVDAGDINISAVTQNNTGGGFSVASLLGAKLDTAAEVNPLSTKPWFEAGNGNAQYEFINAFNNTVIDSNLNRLSDAFIASSGAAINANNQMVGDDVYIAELLVNTLRSNGGVPFITEERDALGQLSSLYNNTQTYMTKTGMGFGQTPTALQASEITAPILVFVAQDQGNGKQVYIPQVWMPNEGEGINAQAGRISTQIIAANNLHISAEHVINDDADLIAGENLVIEAVDLSFSGEERKWYVDVNGQVHYRSAKIAAGDSVAVKLSGNYVQKGGQLLAANQVVVQAKTIDISSKRKANLNVVESFNHTNGKEQKLWQNLLGLGLTRADNILANSVILKAEEDITISRATLRTGAKTQTSEHDGKHKNKNPRHPEHEGKDDDDHNETVNAGDLTLIADNGSISNLGGYLESDTIYLQAAKDITNKSVVEVKNNKTVVKGEWRSGWYDDGDSYSQTITSSQYVTTDIAEIKAGKGGLVQLAGNDINNLGGIVASEGDIVQQAGGSITNKSLATRYLAKETKYSSGTGYGWRGARAPRNLMLNSSIRTTNTARQLASITAGGNLYQTAGNKIINVGSTTRAGGNIIQTAEKGIENKNLITQNNAQSYRRAIQRQGYGYDYDDDYYYRPAPKDKNTNNVIQSANINTVTAGGSLIANAKGGDYLNQGNISANEDIQISATNITNTRQVVGSGNNARAIDSGKIKAGNNIYLQASNNITDTAGRYDAGGNIALNAKNNITQNTLRLTQSNNEEIPGWYGRVVGYDRSSKTTHTAGNFNAEGEVALKAGNNVNLTGTDINAEQITLRGKNINLNAAKNSTSSSTKYGRTYTSNSNTSHNVVKLNSRGNLLVEADNNFTTQGAQIIAGNEANNVLVLNAGGDMRLDGVNNETYSYYHTSSKGWFSSSSTTRESHWVRSQGTNVVAGNLLINTDNVNFIGSQINVENEMLVKAEGDVNIYAGLNFNYDMRHSSKSRWFGLSNSSSGSRRSEALIKASNLESRQGDLSLLSGNNITVAASNLASGNNLNLHAENNILIAAAGQLTENETWSVDSGLFRRGDVYNSTENREGVRAREYIGSNLSAGNNLTLQAARAKIIGSNLAAANNLIAKTDVGDIEIVTAENNEKSYQYKKEVSVGLGGVIKGLIRPDKAISSKNGRLSLKLADATYDEVENKNANTTQVSSVLQAGNTVKLDAAGDIRITGSQLLADASGEGKGDIQLTANGDIVIEDATQRFENDNKETQGKAELSVVVQHQAVEVVNAVKALDKAKKQLKQASEDYRQYKKTLTKQKENLAKLETDYKAKKVGVSYDDIQELREYIESSEDDKTWYEAGIAAATLNVTSKGTLLLQQTAAAAQSAATYGFNAGVELSIDATKTHAEQNQTVAVASILQGNNIYLNNKGDSTIKGSHLNAANDLNIHANNLTVLAGRNTSSDNNKTEHGNITVSQTVYGAAGGPTVNASFDRSRAENTQTSYSNSTLAAKNITLTTKGDATIRGGNVHAQNNLTANIGKNLTIESVQNRTQGKNNSFSISGGFGFGGKEGHDGKTVSNAVDNVGQSNDNVASVNGGLSAGSGRYTTRQTVLSSLTSGNTANINVKEHTQLNGALIATVDENNNDLGNLNLTTNSFGFEDLSNTQFNNNRNVGISTSVSLGNSKANNDNTANKTKLNTSSLQYSNSTGYSKTKTLATLGQGDISIANDDNSLERLNRDSSQTNKDIYKVDRQQGNIDLTVDHRLFSKEGRKQIQEDYKRTAILGEAIFDLSDKSVSLLDNKKDGESSFRQHLMNKQDYFTAVKTFSANKKNEKYIKTLTDGEASVADKQLAYTKLANSVAAQLDIPVTKARILLKQDGSLIKGAYSKETNEIYVVDNYNNTTGDAVNTVGNEVSHHMDAVREGDASYTQTKVYRDNRDSYSDIMGDALENYTSFAFAMNDYDSLNAANKHTGTRNALGRPTKLIQDNNAAFDRLDPNQIEHRQFNYNEAKILDQARYKIKGLNVSSKAKELTVSLLEASGCAKIRCADNVPKSDPRYKQLKQMQDFGDSLAEDSFDSLMTQLGVDTKYKVKVRGRMSRNGRTRSQQGFEYTAGDTVSDYIQAEAGAGIESAQEIVQGGYEFAVFAGAETVRKIYSTENTEGFAKHMAEQVSGTWSGVGKGSIGQTNIDSTQASTWKPGQNTLAELAQLGIEVVPLLKPVSGVVKVVKREKKVINSGGNKAPKIVTGPDNSSAKVDNTQQIKIFTKDTYTGPSGKTYTFYGQNIDLNLEFITSKGKVTNNREWMKKGNNPYILDKDGIPVSTNQHHSQQKASGPIFEIKTSTHKKAENQEVLHQYDKAGIGKNPDDPVDHKIWKKDKSYINKERLKRLELNE